MQITHEGLGEQESAGGHRGGGGSRVKCIQGMHSVAVLAAIKPLAAEWTGYPSIPPGTDALPSSCDTVRRSCSQPFGTVIPPGVLHRETKPPRSLLSHVRCSKIKCCASETLSVGFEEVWRHSCQVKSRHSKGAEKKLR